MNHKKIYIYGAMLAGILTSCTDKMDMPVEFLEGSSKTPIAIQTNLSAALQTRAVDKKFEKDDELLAYIEAGVTTNEGFSSDGNPFKGLKTLKLTADADNTDGDDHANLYNYTITSDGPHITETDGLSPKLYWDNYSSTDYDLRNDGAGIRLKYGYCYNGGTPSTALIESTGKLGWTVQTNQSTADNMKHSDLLFAKTQEPVSYIHGTSMESKHGVLILPYSHAMSKITINVKTGDDDCFDASKANFASSVLTLHHMQTEATVDAPAATVTAVSTAATKDVTTFTKSTANTTATYQAIVAPTNLSAGNLLASITNIDGNNYDIPITEGILSAWSGKLSKSDETIYNGVAQAKPRKAEIPGGIGYLTKPGVHYILNVTVHKQKITIRATLADWDNITAETTAKITFNPDVTTTGTIDDALKTGGFDVYKSSTNDAFSTKSTTVTNVSNVWQYTPTIYWAGQSDNSYFRALSPAGSSTSALAQGGDILWGTSGNTAITPRTGDVPLTFEHLMSKLSINLKTVEGDAAVDLTDAKIAISNMATTATYSIVNGTVTADSRAATMLSGKPSGFAETVIPQTIGNDAKVTITLKDGTTYSVQLNQCVLTGTTTPVSEWTKGKSYTYTITLSKQAITFSAVVKNWVEQSASGNATLDWD